MKNKPRFTEPQKQNFADDSFAKPMQWFSFDLVKIRKEGVDFIIIPLAKSFGLKHWTARQSTWEAIQYVLTNSGMKGVLVFVWDSPEGTQEFLTLPKHRKTFERLEFHGVLEPCEPMEI